MICYDINDAKEEISRIRSLINLSNDIPYGGYIPDVRVGMISGGFDPLTLGHLDYIKEAKQYCDILVVVVNGNKFLVEKKGYFVQTEVLRAEIINSLKWVDVVLVYDKKSTLEDVITELKPTLFMNGGDRIAGNIATVEEEAAKAISCKYITGVGGSDKRSSSKSIINYLRFQFAILEALDEDNPKKKAFKAYHDTKNIYM